MEKLPPVQENLKSAEKQLRVIRKNVHQNINLNAILNNAKKKGLNEIEVLKSIFK